MSSALAHPLLRLLRGSVAGGLAPVVVDCSEVEQLVAGAQRHGLSAWLDAELPTLAPQAPAALRQGLRDDAQATVARNLRNKRLLKRALAALAERGVTPVLLKGLGFGHRYYANALVRSSTDVDLLVAPEQLEVSARVLVGLGLVESEDPGAASHGRDSRHLSFGGSEGLVELHFRALHGFGSSTLELEDLDARCVPGEWEGRSVRYLGIEDEFVYMAGHAANHLFGRLGWALDLELHRRTHPTLDWSRIGQLVEKAGLANALTLAWGVGQRLFGWAPLPSAADAWAAKAVRGRALTRVLSDAQLLSGALASHRVGSFVLRAGMADRPWGVATQLLSGAGRFGRRLAATRGKRAGRSR